MGVPVMATDLLARQLGWQSGLDMVACPADDAVRFGEMLTALCLDETLWNTVRNAALVRIAAECSHDGFTGKICQILKLDVK